MEESTYITESTPIAESSHRGLRGFWHGAGGGKEVLQIAWPMIISSLSWTVMTFVDRVMLRWVSGDAMTAAFQANIVWFSTLCLPMGIACYANTFVSQYHGDEQYRRIGPSVWQAIWFSIICIPMMGTMAIFGQEIFALAGHSTTVRPLEVAYFQTLCWGSGGMLVAQATSTFFSGRGHTQIVMWIEAAFALLNLVLDYVWIFGYLGFPEMGIVGAGYATAVSLWLKAVTYIALMLRQSYRSDYATGEIRFDRILFRRLMKFGGPSGLQMFLDVFGFMLFVMMVGRLGQVETEATSMAFSISSLAFMPIWGIGITAGILVGQRLGENRPDLAERSAWTSIVLGFTYMTAISILYVFAPNIFVSGFFAAATEDAAATDVSRELAITLLRFVAAYNLFDAMFMILSSVIKGAGDTQFVMWTSLVASIVLGSTSFLIIRQGGGVFACWTLVTLWVSTLGLVFFLRFRGGKWKSMRVIDMKNH